MKPWKSYTPISKPLYSSYRAETSPLPCDRRQHPDRPLPLPLSITSEKPQDRLPHIALHPASATGCGTDWLTEPPRSQ